MINLSEAFVYMFVVGSGTASGVAVVGLATYKFHQIMKKRSEDKQVKRRGVV